jgi:hypothetical protein
MNRSPADRLHRLVRHALRGWTRSRHDPDVRDRARRWLLTHPSAWALVDRLWLDALNGRGDLAAWLDAGADPDAWRDAISLHSVLSGHPFPDLAQWSTPPTSPES